MVVRVFEFVWIEFLSRGKAHLWLEIVAGRKGRVKLGAYGRRGACRHGVFVEMTDDAVNDFGVGKNRDDLHFRTTFRAQEWVHLEDFSDQACPIGPAGFGGFRARSRVLLPLGWRDSRRVVLKERFACPVAIGPVVAS